jgi:anthranilate phosphoribosyltransferase
MSDSPRFADVFREFGGAGGLGATSARRAFEAILNGQWTPVQVAGFLVALRLHGESAELIAAAAEAMRAAMVPVEHGLPRVLDTCGTGGDGHATLNLSTGAAILVAACGVPVGKHGNRAISSRSGSADVLEALGIATDLAPAHAAAVLREANIAFLMAPAHHPAMKHAALARSELGIRTLFNCLGPLANPARATHQLLGAYDDGLRKVLAETLRVLGSRRAWVVHSLDGLDEVSPFGPTRVTELDGQTLSELTIAPEDFGLVPLRAGAIDGRDPAFNARVIESVLSGEPQPASDAFVLNAAAALVVVEGIAPRTAAARIQETIASGAAKNTLLCWRNAVRARREGAA